MIIILAMILILLVPSSAEFVFLKQPIDMEVIAGRTTGRFNCVLDKSSVDLRVRWIHTDLGNVKREYPVETITQIRENYHIVGEASNGDFSIIVTNATKSDAGTFRCRVRRQNDGITSESTEGNLTILLAPSDGYPKCTSSKLQNGETKLNCMVDSKASPVNINWTRSGETDPLTKITQSRNLSTYLMLNANDNGVAFQCRISGNSVYSERFCDIIPMNQPPIAEFRSGLTETSMAIGGRVALKCDSIGKPYVSKLRWYYGDRQIEKTYGRFKISMDETILDIYEMTEMDHDKPVTCEASIPSGLATNITRYLNIYKVVTFKPQTIAPASTKKISNESSLLILVISSVAAICILLIIIICMCYEKINRLSNVKTAYPLNNGLILRMQTDSPRNSIIHNYSRDSFGNDIPMVDTFTKSSTLPNQPGGFQTVVCYPTGPDSPAICYPVSTPVSAKSSYSTSPYFKNTARNTKSASFCSTKQSRDSKCKANGNSTQFSSMNSLSNVYDTIQLAKKTHERTGSL